MSNPDNSDLSSSESEREDTPSSAGDAPKTAHDLLDAHFAEAQKRVEEEHRKQLELHEKEQEEEREHKRKEEDTWAEHVKNTQAHAVWLVAIDGSEDALRAA